MIVSKQKVVNQQSSFCFVNCLVFPMILAFFCLLIIEDEDYNNWSKDEDAAAFKGIPFIIRHLSHFFSCSNLINHFRYGLHIFNVNGNSSCKI